MAHAPRPRVERFAILDGNNIVAGFCNWVVGNAWDGPAGTSVAPGTPGSGAVLGATYNPATKTYTPPAAPVPTVPEQAQAALGKGFTVTCTSIPSLSGRYPVTERFQNEMVALRAYYANNNSFPNGQATAILTDVKNNPHAFPLAQFRELFKVLGDYRASLKGAEHGVLKVLPPASGTIA